MPDLSTDIAEQAVEPLSVTADGQTTVGRTMQDMIDADRYLATKTASANRRRGLFFTRLLPPGCVSDQGRGNSNL